MENMLVIEVQLLAVGIQMVPDSGFGTGIQNPCISEESRYGKAVKSDLTAADSLLEIIVEFQAFHDVLEEKYPIFRESGASVIFLRLCKNNMSEIRIENSDDYKQA